MKALKTIGIIIGVLLLLIIIAGIIAPKDYDISRSAVVNASPDVVYKNISTFAAFNQWNPWSKKDPNQVVTEEGTDGTVGAKHSWKGNKMVGEGSMTLTKAEPDKGVEYSLDFMKPFEAHNIAYMNMEPAEGGQKVTWGLKMHMAFPMNVMGLFMNMDKNMGKDFEEGLGTLKTMTESAPKYTVKEVEWAERNCLAVREVVKFKDMPKFFGDKYPDMFETIAKSKSEPGTPLAVFYKYDEKNMEADMAVAIPYKAKKDFGKKFSTLCLPSGPAYAIDYFGAYEKMKPAYNEMNAYLKRTYNRENPDLVIEEYITDPMKEKDTAKWETKIYFFVNKDVAKK